MGRYISKRIHFPFCKPQDFHVEIIHTDLMSSAFIHVCGFPSNTHTHFPHPASLEKQNILGLLRVEHNGVIVSRFPSVQFSSVAQLCLTLCDPMNCSIPGLPVHHQLPEFTQTHVHWVGDAIQPSHPLSSPSPPALNLSQHQGPFQWVSSSHQVAKVLEFQLQHQSFQWTPRTDFL